MNKEAMDYVREDCRHDAMIDKAEDVRRWWPWNGDDEDDRIEPYDEMEDVKHSNVDWEDF